MPSLFRFSLTAALVLAILHGTKTRAAGVVNYLDEPDCSGDASYECENLQPRECCYQEHDNTITEITSSWFYDLPEDAFSMINLNVVGRPTPCHGDILAIGGGGSHCLWRPTIADRNVPGNEGETNTQLEYHAANYERMVNVIVEVNDPPAPPPLPGIAGMVAVGSTKRRRTAAERRSADLRKRESAAYNDTQFWEGFRFREEDKLRLFDPDVCLSKGHKGHSPKACKIRKPDVVTFSDGHKFRITKASDEEIKKFFQLLRKKAKYEDIPKELKKYEIESDKVTFRLQDWKRKDADRKPLKDMTEKEKKDLALKAWDIPKPEREKKD